MYIQFTNAYYMQIFHMMYGHNILLSVCILCHVLHGTLSQVGECTAGPGDVKTFGPDCQYQCHCKNGTACDEDKGYCQNNCDIKWYGPGCQLSDLAETEIARHLDNIKPGRWARYANDGDKASCSYTNTAKDGASRTRPPWWRVQTPKLETIWEMVFLTKEEYLHYFKEFKVTVETAPANKAGEGNYYPPETEVRLCYQHDNSVPSNESIHVTCGTLLTGNVVRIELASKNSQLVLCDVRIYGGRNLAFKKNVAFSAAMDEDLHPATLVVDGDSRNSPLDYCFSTEQSNSDYWVTVDLGHLAFINRIKITKYNDDRIQDYEIYVSNTTEQMDAVLAYSDNSKYPPNLEVSMHTTGQFVKLERPKNRDATVICELEIYGECSTGKCGFNCLTECHCKTFEERVSGVCTSGCEGRWTGPGLECINNCDETHWGEQCTLQCGRCKDFQPCDVLTGYCKSGCQNGTLETPLCDTDCPNGTYGENCTLECSGNCNDKDSCRKTDGHCERGCSPGFTYDKCDTKCPRGSYGFNCSSTCSVNCASVFSDCDHNDGSCFDGCLPGWEGSRCEKKCDAGFWGMNCANMCGHCLSGTCNTRNGECSGGCDAGFKDTPKCDQECDIYNYGDNCSRFCSPKCKNVCDRVNGTCSNCTTGWKGSKCLQECDSGEWGENCENQCGHCLNGSCDTSDGTCDGGCSPGYKTTEMCTEKCDVGFWGKNCVEVCGNCSSGICDARNGECSGDCEARYKNTPKCDQAKLNNSKDAIDFPVAAVVGGLLVAVVVILLALVFLLLRRKKRKLPKNMTDHDASRDRNYLSPAYSTALYANENIPTDHDYDNVVQTREGAYEALQEETTEMHHYETPTNDANQSFEEREGTAELHFYENPYNDPNQSDKEREGTTESQNYETASDDAYQSVVESMIDVHVYNTLQN
ncbi:protein draper-like [Ruditapes philippinarum]|uniref:protein draper-like n=1 Tax=Ruditapes philippinarum TaxID=129788 RepID=UPI00295BB623|nr:protein draper-like [Ruditapes philippinarum]